MQTVFRYAALVVLVPAVLASTGCGDSSPTSPSCTYSVDRTTVTLPPGGGSGAIAVTTGPACAWTASSNAAWLTITSTANGTGNGSVTFSAGANGPSPRSATLTVGGQTTATVAVSQDAPRFSLSGKVTDVFLGSGPRGYLALSGVSVTVVEGPSQGSASTDSRGEYTISGLLPGRYTVSFTKAAYRTTTTTIEITTATTLLVSLALETPAPLSTSNLTGYWSGTGTYPNAPFKLALVHEGGSNLRGTYLDGLDEGPIALLTDPPSPLPPYSPGRFTLAVNFGDAILYLECTVENERLITGVQRTSALGWTRTFPFTMTR